MITTAPTWMKPRTFRFAGSAVEEVTVFEGRDENALLDAAVESGAPTPYGVIVWASAVVVADRLARTANVPARVVDVGAGCGLVPMVCAARGATTIALDHSAPTRELIIATAAENNVSVNVADFDIMGPDSLPEADLYLFIDMLYEPGLMAAIVRHLREICARGARAIVADPDRFSRNAFEMTLHTEGLPVRREEVSAAPFGFEKTTIYVYDVGPQRGDSA